MHPRRPEQELYRRQLTPFTPAKDVPPAGLSAADDYDGRRWSVTSQNTIATLPPAEDCRGMRSAFTIDSTIRFKTNLDRIWCRGVEQTSIDVSGQSAVLSCDGFRWSLLLHGQEAAPAPTPPNGYETMGTFNGNAVSADQKVYGVDIYDDYKDFFGDVVYYVNTTQHSLSSAKIDANGTQITFLTTQPYSSNEVNGQYLFGRYKVM